MSLFAWCVIAHFVGDFLFQTGYEARNKAEGRFLNLALLTHVAKYTGAFVMLCLAGLIAWPWLILIFVSHTLIDRRWPVIAWRRHINGDGPEAIQSTFWLTIVIDQIFHLIVLAIICALA